jgi:type I restriction enzyme S subunit
MDDETAALFPDSFAESELGMIPKGWEKSVLGDVLSALESGKRPKGGAQNEGVPSLGAESIRNLGQFDFASTKYVSPQFFQSMNSGKVKPYDVLVYKDGAGAGAHVTMFGEGFPYEDFAINEHVFLLRSDQVPQSYLFFWLNNENYKSLMVELAQKSAQPGLNQKDMKSIPILKPDSSMLAAFSELISPIVEMIMENSLQSYSLGQIREVLLPRLISGELQIPEELLVS